MKKSYKTLISIILVVFLCIGMAGCGIFSHGQNGNTIGKAQAKVELIQDNINRNNVSNVKEIGVLSDGVNYALSKDTNNSVPVSVAKTLNFRIGSLSDSPNIDELNNMHTIVDELTSSLTVEKNKGLLKLAQKDKEILYIQTERDSLKKDLEVKQQKLSDVAQQIANTADVNKEKLDGMNSWFGLGAVFYGIKRFITSSVLILSIGAILFFVLKIFAASNPIVGGIFGVFESIGAMVLSGIKSILPKSFAIAKFTPTVEHNLYKDTLTNIIDNIQLLKEKSKDSPKQYSLDEAMDVFSKSLDQDEKDLIESIKNKIGWKKQ